MGSACHKCRVLTWSEDSATCCAALAFKSPSEGDDVVVSWAPAPANFRLGDESVAVLPSGFRLRSSSAVVSIVVVSADDNTTWESRGSSMAEGFQKSPNRFSDFCIKTELGHCPVTRALPAGLDAAPGLG